MNELEQLRALLAPRTTEQDATAVDVYGLKSKAADDIAQNRQSITGHISDPNIVSRGGKNIFGQETGAFTLEDLSNLVMGTTGGSLKGIGKGIKNLGLGKRRTDVMGGRKVGNIKLDSAEQLFEELQSGGLDVVDFRNKLFELQQMAPELASKIISGGF